MPRHLDPDFHESTLNRGKSIECFLGAGDAYEGAPTIRWISVDRESDGFVVRLYEAVDPRDPDFLDIYAFQFTAEESDEPIKEERHEELAAALQQAREWGGDIGRFVNQGMAGHEYGDYLARAG
jgi:hypothetical protein